MTITGVSGHPSGGKPPLLKIKRQLSAYRLVSDVKKSFFFFFTWKKFTSVSEIHSGVHFWLAPLTSVAF